MKDNVDEVLIGMMSETVADRLYKVFKPTDVHADESNEMTNSPLESGIRHLDHKVFNPTKIEVVGYVSAYEVDEFKSIANRMMDEMDFNKALCWVSSKSETYENLIMVGLKESDKKDMFDQIEFTLSFMMALIEDVDSNNDGNSDTKQSGMMGSDGNSRAVSWYEDGQYFTRSF